MAEMTLKKYFEELPADTMSPRTKFVKQLATECKVDESTVYRWIKGKARPNDLAKSVISKVTNIPIDNLGL